METESNHYTATLESASVVNVKAAWKGSIYETGRRTKNDEPKERSTAVGYFLQ